ncbi:MAG: cyclase family protein [Acidobacteriota bacterium]
MPGRFEIVDLSIPFHVGMPKYQASWFPAFAVSEVSPESMPEAQWKRRFTTLGLFAHNGTHVETSDHAFRDGRTICRYDLARFAGVPAILDLSTIPEATEITIDLIEDRLPQITGRPDPDGSILLIRTGYNDRAWGSADFWQRSPFLGEAAAQAIADAGFGFVGLDFQTERPGERDFVVHKALLSRGVLLCEYLVNLHRLGPDSIFIATPLSIRDVEASPTRAIALNFH